MRTIIILFILSLIISNTYAQEVDETLARKVAENYFDRNVPDSIKARYRLMTQNTCDAKLKVKKTILKTFNGKPSYYINNIEGGGWVLVSADKKTGPVIAHSEFGSYDPNNLPEVITYWMSLYDQAIEVRRQKDTVFTEKAEKWTKYENDITLKSSGIFPNYLVQTKWHQENPYNNFNTEKSTYNTGILDAGSLCLAGCPSITISQIVNYWGFAQGDSADFEFWHMPNAIIASTTPQIEQDAICYMIRTIGKNRLHSQYCIKGFASTGSTHQNEAYTELGYDYGEYHVFNLLSSESGWRAMLRTSLNANCPVDYRYEGDGKLHEFICDGYNSGNDNFHFNLGYNETGGSDLWMDFEDLAIPHHDFSDQKNHNFYRFIYPIVDSDKVLTGTTINNGENKTWQVLSNLVANSLIINSGAKSQLVAGTSVILQPGFWAKAGSRLTAKAYINENLRAYSLKSAHINNNLSAQTATNLVVSKETGIKVFPNPTFGDLTIEIATPGSGSFQIFDLRGTLALSGNLDSQRTKISLGNIPQGLYLLKIIFNEKVYQFKVTHN